ncbi:F-box only protein 27 [Rhinophrynus dorsalis]
MGTSTSSPHLPLLDLEPLPDEILLVVLSFLPPRYLVTRCRLVSKRWRMLVDSPTLWRMKCERERRTEVLRAAHICTEFCWPKACVKASFCRNLLRNPCGTEKLKHWDVVHGGDGWVVENNNSHVHGAESQTCFVTSYGWCKKTQIIDLLKEGLWEHFLDHHQPQIHISDWFGGRNDCGCVYKIDVQLLAADRVTVIQEFSCSPVPIPQWNDQNYHQVSHAFCGYGPGVRFVRFSHMGKDTQFWKGWYGARITNSSVTLRCDDVQALAGPCTHVPFHLHLR